MKFVIPPAATFAAILGASLATPNRSNDYWLVLLAVAAPVAAGFYFKDWRIAAAVAVAGVLALPIDTKTGVKTEVFSDVRYD